MFMFTLFFAFYRHNGPLFWYLVLTAVSLGYLLLRPTRRHALLLLSFFCLVLSFEYQKHLLDHMRTHVLYPLFPLGSRFRKFSILEFLLEDGFPFGLDLLGWSLLVCSLFTFDNGPREK